MSRKKFLHRPSLIAGHRELRKAWMEYEVQFRCSRDDSPAFQHPFGRAGPQGHRMKNLSKHDPTLGGGLAAACGMALRADVQQETRARCATEDSQGSSRGAASPADPARAVVADKLARMIHIGLLEAGDPLPSERSLCEMFRVARQSVRAALGILEGRLMVAISHGRRSRVLGPGRLNEVDGAGALKPLRARHAPDIYEALLVLDAQMASLIARHIKTRNLDQLDVLLESLPHIARDPLCYQMLDYEIRTLIYTSCGNSLLADIAMDFYGHASPQRRQLFADQSELRRSAELQASLAKALRERDAHQIALIMREQTEDIAAQPFQERSAAADPTPCISASGNVALDTYPLTLARGVFWPAPSATT